MEETKQGYRDKLSQDVHIARVWHMKQKTLVVTSTRYTDQFENFPADNL